ncbi:histidinol-phosphatase [Bacillus sp. B1-b2]|uniref:histidinol-phosphatase n=1 Tax=Bacillus sp. B1-b2 TaxID=2653201 RepID=UPI001D0186E9|nr:histidinol-phosphatase [Bacillus sp. B1-b2]
MSNILFDLHTHHDRCGHAIGALEEYIESAIDKGLHYIGISDHSPLFFHEEDRPFPRFSMAKSEFSVYVEHVLRLKEKYKEKIHVLLGVESDYYPHHLHLYKKEYDKSPFDYIIGSVHYVNGRSIFDKNRWTNLSEKEKVQEKEDYYRMIQESAKSGVFQVLGHIDAMKGYYPEFSAIKTPIIDETLKVISDTGVAIEVNTSGKTKDVGGWYPSHEILERALFYGVDISYGSDAHLPERVGDDYLLVQKALKDIGFKEMVFFVEKKKQIVRL